MLSLQNLSLRIGSKLLFEDANLTIYSGQKIGIVGRNGSGKTSLFRLLQGELTPDSGDLKVPEKMRIAHMRQETSSSQLRAVDYVIAGHQRYVEIQQQLQQAEVDHDNNAIARLHAELELIDGYQIENTAEQLLSGLGFQVADFSRPVADFSGGWRIRLNLAQALIQPSELLLLDEPTNHLDLEAAMWLQQWLNSYQGTLLLISHDRSFLDQVVDFIGSLEQGRLTIYKGNYSAFEIQRAEFLSQQQAAYEKQQQRKSEIEDFVRRFRAKATKAKQAQSRLKELTRMQEIAPAHVDSPFQFRIPEPDKIPDTLLACEHLSIGYETPLINDFSLNLAGDARLGLLGPNGQGKSTLLKVLTGEMAPLSGSINRSDHLRIGYFAQHQADALDVSLSPLELILSLSVKAREQHVRDFLGRFDFRGDMVSEPIVHFSGGEKSRLALALVVWQKPNLLLLDEPTNHLDLEMCHALTLALQEYNGAIVLVSHDRYLLENVVDEFLLIHDGRLDHFDGTLADYEQHILLNKKASPKNKGRKVVEPRVDKKVARQQAAQLRNQLKPLREKIKKLERNLEKISKELAVIDEKLSDNNLYDEERKEDLNALLLEQGKLRTRLAEVEEDWMEATELLDQAG